MTQAKIKAIVVAVTAAVVLAVCVMLVVLTIQFVTLNKLQADKARLDAAIAQIKEEKSNAANQIDFFGNQQALENMYRSQGYGKGNEIIFI